MNKITWQLIKKDWHFNRLPMLGYAVLGVIALALIAVGSGATFLVGSILLITVVVAIGIHLVFVTVIYERAKQTLPFVMSLPITFMQYSVAKLIANLGIFLLGWTALFVAVCTLLLSHDALPAGLLPFATIIMTELLVANILILAVAMISESEAWTIVVMAICNVGISLFMFFTKSFPDIGDHVTGTVAVWNRTALTFIGLELFLAVALIAATLFVQSRKHDYV